MFPTTSPRLLASLLLVASFSLSALAGPPYAVPTPSIVDPGHAGLAHWFTALKAAESGSGVARAVQFGDSTIVADGLTSTIRSRLVARFGDAGPGFVSAGLNPTWNQRSDVVSSRGGDWEWRTILLGGASGRYGLGGIVGIVRSGAYATIRAVDASKTPVPQRHVELWYQGGVGYGSYWISADDKEIGRGSAVNPQTDDRRFQMDLPDGFTKLAFGATGGTVPIYGVVLETGKPGVTWEALGVTGVGSRSFTTYAGAALKPQLEQRNPDLVVIMLGGNESGYSSLLSRNGSAYEPMYEAGVSTILAGQGDASCLILSPLDQGFVDETDGSSKARPGMANMVSAQSRVATAHGCAFWSTFDAMGGAGSALRWANLRGLGSGDMVHLTPKGLDMLGNLLADELLKEYDDWAQNP